MSAQKELLDALDSKNIPRIKRSLSNYADSVQKVRLQVEARELLTELNKNVQIDDNMIEKMRKLVLSQKSAWIGVVGTDEDVKNAVDILCEYLSLSSQEIDNTQALNFVKSNYNVLGSDDWKTKNFKLSFEQAITRAAELFDEIDYNPRIQEGCGNVIFGFRTLEQLKELKSKQGRLIFVCRNTRDFDQSCRIGKIISCADEDFKTFNRWFDKIIHCSDDIESFRQDLINSFST